MSVNARAAYLQTAARRSWWGLILAEHDTEPMELLGGYAMVGLGLLILLPGDILHSSPAYATLAIVPEPLLGSLLLGLGLWKWEALRRGHRVHRRATSGLSFLVWFLLMVSFTLSVGSSFGVILFSTAVLSAGWTYVRLGSADL